MADQTPRVLLKAADIAAMAPLRKPHPLNPAAVRLQKSLGDAAGLGQFGFNLVTIEPGVESTEYHFHHFAEECLYILSGHGQADIDGQLHEVGPGDFMGFPCRGAAHTLRNTGAEPLVYLVAGPRQEHDVCDYPRKRKRLYYNGDLRQFVDLPTKD